VSVAVRKIQGVESAKVSLNQGLVSIELKPGNSVSLEQGRKTITDQGFTPKQAKVAAVGDLISSNGRLDFRVTGSNDLYEVVPTTPAAANDQTGTEVTVTGLVPSPEGKPKRNTIQIMQAEPTKSRKVKKNREELGQKQAAQSL
jgi:hypothetical protein